MVTALDEHRTYLPTFTAITTQMVSPAATTDAYIRDQDYTTYCGLTWDSPSIPGLEGTIGLNTCVALNSAGECERSDVRFDTSTYAALGPTGRRSLACHEIGHSLGLMHRQEQCMGEGASALTLTAYSQHDKDHLQYDIN